MFSSGGEESHQLAVAFLSVEALLAVHQPDRALKAVLGLEAAAQDGLPLTQGLTEVGRSRVA